MSICSSPPLGVADESSLITPLLAEFSDPWNDGWVLRRQWVHALAGTLVLRNGIARDVRLSLGSSLRSGKTGGRAMECLGPAAVLELSGASDCEAGERRRSLLPKHEGFS